LNDESYIKLTLELAKKGIGSVSPNPLVGAVIIKNDRIIGAGYHEKFGSNHAEVNAILNAKESIEGSTLVVNLEPCSHHGKTPPCADRIIESKIKKVVIGSVDPNPLVAGNGIKKLKEAGIEVVQNVLNNECIELNKFFFKFISKGLPYVTLKIAQTIDSKIADKKYNSKWITSAESRTFVHNLRTEYDAVLIGSNTVKEDNPSLTVRHVEGRNPKRIILDTNLSLSTKYQIFNSTNIGEVILLTSKESKNKVKKLEKFEQLGVKVIFCKTNSDGIILLKSALKKIAKENIISVMVEGGSRVFSSFIAEKLFDELIVFIGPKLIGEGICSISNIGIKSIKRPYKLHLKDIQMIGGDAMLNYRV
jgi:diaminohydroxyphosphoribosylaminopyrimidine deaminase/5-amino-6-(5-phosphoribosylamino)uracil reductase